MIVLEKTRIYGWDEAVRGMRNPMNSWELSDSGECGDYRLDCETCPFYEGNLDCYGHHDYIIGKRDHNLMQKLINAGTDHRKFMRMITVYTDITAPFYWWKEFDTYKVGTVANSCSTMHKIASEPITRQSFSFDTIGNTAVEIAITRTIENCEELRKLYLSTKDKKYWRALIQLLPESWMQKRTVMLNYEVLRNMYHARKNHKLTEWHEFCDWIKSLPYSELIVGENNA